MNGAPQQRSSLLQEATERAEMARSTCLTVDTSVSASHPLEDAPATDPSLIASEARKQWRDHGEGVSQALEERRRNLSNGIIVKVISGEERVDLSGSRYVAYVVGVTLPQETKPSLVEHRYSDFAKLNTLLRKNEVKLDSGFPSKHWAGRMGNWTPSQTWAPQEYENLVSYRKVQLDFWLVELCEKYNQDSLPPNIKTEVWEFLTVQNRQPCDRVNQLDSTSSTLNMIKCSNPLSFTLGSSIRQAAYIVRHMTSNESLSHSDQSIPLDLLYHAKGLCFLTVVKAGLVVSGRVGTGLVVARRDDGKWSAPSALGTLGLGWGALAGGDITHYLVVFTTKQGVETLCRQTSVQLGAELGVAVGPVGRGASMATGDWTLHPSYAYAHSQGFFIGMSLEGSVVSSRQDVNAKFYGKPATAKELLLDNITEPPVAAQPLYDALDKALQVDPPKEGFRPSQLWQSGIISSPSSTATYEEEE